MSGRNRSLTSARFHGTFELVGYTAHLLRGLIAPGIMNATPDRCGAHPAYIAAMARRGKFRIRSS